MNTWGNYSTKEVQFVARVKTAVISSPEEPFEALSIMFKKADGGAHMVVGFGKCSSRATYQNVVI